MVTWQFSTIALKHSGPDLLTPSPPPPAPSNTQTKILHQGVWLRARYNCSHATVTSTVVSLNVATVAFDAQKCFFAQKTYI